MSPLCSRSRLPHPVARLAQAARAANSTGRIRNAVSRTAVPRHLLAPRRDRPARRLGSGTLRRAAACPNSLPRPLRPLAVTAGAGTTPRSAVSSRPRQLRTLRPPPSPPSLRHPTLRPRLNPPSPLLLALAVITSGSGSRSPAVFPTVVTPTRPPPPVVPHARRTGTGIAVRSAVSPTTRTRRPRSVEGAGAGTMAQSAATPTLRRARRPPPRASLANPATATAGSATTRRATSPSAPTT